MLTWLRIKWNQFKVNHFQQFEYVKGSESFFPGWFDNRSRIIVDTTASFKDLNKARTNMGELPDSDQWGNLSEKHRDEIARAWVTHGTDLPTSLARLAEQYAS